MTNELDTKINITINMKIKRIFFKINDKLITELNTKISNEFTIHLSEINSIFIIKLGKINGKLIAKIKKINSHNTDYIFKVQKIFNNITMRINSIEEVYYNNFALVNISIKAF